MPSDHADRLSADTRRVTAGHRRWPLLLGVGLALAAGVGLGFWARPQLAVEQGPQAALATGVLPIAVDKPAPPAPPKVAGRLEVLPPEMAQASHESFKTNAVTPPAPQQPVVAEAAPTLDVPAAPTLQASFDCQTARAGAEQVVCSDPALAADDRRLAQAYRRALQSGADPDALRQDQQDWLMIREDAAERSPRALEQVYGQRTAELDEIARTAAADGR